jgi:hypothetical protein
MILLYIFFFVAGVVTFLVTSKLGLPLRVGVALAIFFVPSILVTLWLLKVGDKPPPDARIINPQDTIQTPKK